MDKTNAGKRVRLIRCDDKFTKLKVGSEGTYEYSMPGVVPGETQHTIRWDDGSTLMLVTPHDAFAFIEFGKCDRCGKEYAVLIDGHCGECHIKS